MDWLEIENEQNELFKKFYTVGRHAGKVPDTSLLHRVLSSNDRDLCSAFGFFGLQLRDFVYAIDLQHPGFNSFHSGNFVSDLPGTFSKDAGDLLRIATYANNWDMSPNVIANLKRVTQQHNLWPILSKSINDPCKNQLHVRFVKSAVVRDSIRRTKKLQHIDLRILKKRGVKEWNAQSASFKNFFRFDSRYSTELNVARNRYNHFRKMGLVSMANEINYSINDLELRSSKTTYFGFNKITYTQAAIVLAKLAGFEYKPSEGGGEVTISPDVLEHPFLPNSNKSLTLTPRAYSLHELIDLAPERVLKVVQYVEALPELDGKPAFDHYRVIVPGTYFPHIENGPIYLPDVGQVEVKSKWYNPSSGKSKWYDRIEDVYRVCDSTLMKKRSLPAALIGEKDRESYFLCHWL